MCCLDLLVMTARTIKAIFLTRYSYAAIVLCLLVRLSFDCHERIVAKRYVLGETFYTNN